MYNLSFLQNKVERRYDNQNDFTIDSLYKEYLYKIEEAEGNFTTDSIYTNWHYQIKNAKNNLLRWEENVHNYFHLKYRQQLFDSQDPSHPAEVKKFKLLWSTEEFLGIRVIFQPS